MIIDNWKWDNERKGYVVTSKINGYEGNFIFIPAAGYCDGTEYGNVDNYGNYWTSSLYNDIARAYYVHFDSGDHYMGNSRRNYGRPIRPVATKEANTIITF